MPGAETESLTSIQVQLPDEDARDLEGLYEFTDRHDLATGADVVPERFDRALQGLAGDPQRGSDTRELLDVGVREYGQVFLQLYCIVCGVIGDSVSVLLIADGGLTTADNVKSSSACLP